MYLAMFFVDIMSLGARRGKSFLAVGENAQLSVTTLYSTEGSHRSINRIESKQNVLRDHTLFKGRFNYKFDLLKL